MMSKNNKDKANIYTYPFPTPAAAMYVMKDGGQQELLDQVAMHPDKNYNERVNAYINKVKQLAMDKVQEEMLEASTGYGEETDAIMSMIPMAQMGMQFNPQAYKTIDAFTQAAKPKKDMGKLFTNALFPTMFSKAWKENTPIEDQYDVKFKGVKNVTAKDLEKYYEKPKAQEGKAVQGSPTDEVVDNGDGTITVYQADGTSRRYANKDQFKKLYKPSASKQAQVTKELPTTTTSATFTIDPKAAEAAREAESAKYVFSKDTNTATKETPKQWDGNVIEGSNQRPVWQPEAGYAESEPSGSGAQANVAQQNLVGDGYDWFRALIPGGGQRGALMRGEEPEAFFAPNTVVAGVRGEYRFNPANIFRSSENKRPGALKSASILFGDYDPLVGATTPFGQSPQDFIPVVPNQTAGQERREERQAERAQRQEDKTARREEKAADILQRATQKAQNIKEKFGIASEASMLDKLKPNEDETNMYLFGTEGSQIQEPVLKKGGALEKFLRKAQNGVENPGDGRTYQQTLDLLKPNFDEQEPQIQDPVIGFNPNDVKTPVPYSGLSEFTDGPYIESAITNPKEAKYKVRSKNPYAAPAILAGMNAVAGALENREAMAQQKELMNRLSFDQMATELRGSEGDYAFNTGMFRPDQMVPVQFTGYNNPMSQFGGAFEKDQEYYLDDNTIQAILAAGGEIEYLD